MMNAHSIEKIVIATDGSEYTHRAIAFGLSLAKKLGAKVYALSVLDIAPVMSVPIDGAWKGVFDLMHEECFKATAYVKEAGEEIGVEVETVVLEGKPAEKIVEYAEENDIDLVVMGTTGKSGLDRILLGSVAERVVKLSHVPVLVVRSDQEIKNRKASQ